MMRLFVCRGVAVSFKLDDRSPAVDRWSSPFLQWTATSRSYYSSSNAHSPNSRDRISRWTAPQKAPPRIVCSVAAMFGINSRGSSARCPPVVCCGAALIYQPRGPVHGRSRAVSRPKLICSEADPGSRVKLGCNQRNSIGGVNTSPAENSQD